MKEINFLSVDAVRFKFVPLGIDESAKEAQCLWEQIYALLEGWTE